MILRESDQDSHQFRTATGINDCVGVLKLVMSERYRSYFKTNLFFECIASPKFTTYFIFHIQRCLIEKGHDDCKMNF